MKTLNLTDEEASVIVSALAVVQLFTKKGYLKPNGKSLSSKEIDFLLVRIVQELELDKTHPELKEAYRLLENEDEKKGKTYAH